MTALSKWQSKLILLFKSERTFNAQAIVSEFTKKTIAEMKETIITEAVCNTDALSDKPRTKDLTAHLDNLKHQFIGQSELCFYHATLVVLLRRNYKTTDIFAEFQALWESEFDYLLKHLSLRWIVSACDTFIDYSDNNNRATILLNVVTLVNTLKVYETKQFLQLNDTIEQTQLLTDKVNALYHSHLPLYDGLTYFRIGTDDSLKNMRSRYEKFYAIDKMATIMLLFIFDKLQSNNSAFATLRALHTDEKSQWWLD